MDVDEKEQRERDGTWNMAEECGAYEPLPSVTGDRDGCSICGAGDRFRAGVWLSDRSELSALVFAVMSRAVTFTASRSMTYTLPTGNAEALSTTKTVAAGSTSDANLPAGAVISS